MFVISGVVFIHFFVVSAGDLSYIRNSGMSAKREVDCTANIPVVYLNFIAIILSEINVIVNP